HHVSPAATQVDPEVRAVVPWIPRAYPELGGHRPRLLVSADRLDERERHRHRRRDAGGGGDAAVDHVAPVRNVGGARMLEQGVAVVPMAGETSAIEQTGPTRDECAGAHR